MSTVDALRDVAPEVFDDTPVVLAYLFGSQARGEAGPRSDVDVAVYLDPHDGDTALDLSLRLAGELEARAGVAPVEALVVLNHAPIALSGRVREEGVLLYSRDEPFRVRWESLTSRRYHDFKIHQQRSARERLARIAGDD